MDKAKRIRKLNAAIASAIADDMVYECPSFEALLGLMEKLTMGAPDAARAKLAEDWTGGPCHLAVVKAGPYLGPTAWTASRGTRADGVRVYIVALGVSEELYQALRGVPPHEWRLCPTEDAK